MNIYSERGVSLNGFPQMNQNRPGIQGRANLSMNVTSARHMQPTTRPADADRVTEGFAAALGEALDRVERLNRDSRELTRKAIYEPDSVELHEVMIASQKSSYALNLTKSLSDGFVRAFRDLTNPR